jgi:hypothetical protein
MHINWKTDRSLPTAAHDVLGTETIPLNKECHNKGYRHKHFLCSICARTKITRKSFGKKANVTSKEYLDRVTININVYLNYPSRKGYKYKVVFIDEATKQFWYYGLHERTADAVLTCLYQLYLKELPSEAKIKYFHSDEGGELITESVKSIRCKEH